MPPSVDKPGVRGGVTEACLFNDHSMCNNPRCGCDCHIQAAAREVIAQSRPDIPVQAGPEKSCPKCGIKRPGHEIFCRIDGERLSSLLCNLCGAGREPEDKFCHQCGGPANATKPEGAELPRVINVPSIPDSPSVNNGPEVDYGKSILARIQEELGNDGPVREQNQPQVVVETPAGTQGSFKLVSRPNPNKVRVPAGGRQTGEGVAKPSPQGNRSGFKLPIKPS